MNRPASPTPPTVPVPPPVRPGRSSLPLAVSLVANAALAGWVVYSAVNNPTGDPHRPAVNGAASAAATANAVEALGRVQPAGGVISVFGPPGDRITDLKVGLGSPVKKGDLLAALAGDKERTLSVSTLDAQRKEAESLQASIRATAQAKLADIDAEAAQAKKAAESDVAAASARIKGLTEQLRQARAERERLATIEAGNVAVAAQTKEEAALLVTRAENELTAAQTQLAKAQEQLRSAPELTAAKKRAVEAEAERGLAQVPYESLKAAKAAAEQKVRDAAVIAPVDGRVVRVLAQPGDTLATQPVLQIAATEQMVVRAEVYESDVPTLHQWLATAGGEVAAEIDPRVLAAPGETPPVLRGTLSAAGLSPTIAQNTVFALGPREDADRRVVEAEVRLDAAASKAVANLIGLQVRVRFLPPAR